MYRIKQFYIEQFEQRKTIMCTQHPIEEPCKLDPPWEGPQVIPAQLHRVDNLILPQAEPVFPRQRGRADHPHARVDHRVSLPPPERAGVPAGHRAGVFHHPLHGDEHFAADGAQGLHPAAERAAGRPAQAAGAEPRRASNGTKRPCCPSTRPTTMWPDC